MSTTVCTISVPAAALRPGAIVASDGRAVYLIERGGGQWITASYDDAGNAHEGIAEYPDGAEVTVVAQALDGTVILP